MPYPTFPNPFMNYQQPLPQPASIQPRYEIIHVNGRNGAEAMQMAPNSNALLLDDTAPIVWLAQTDGAGYKTLSAFDISPHEEKPAVDLSSLETRIAKLEEKINESNNANNGNNKQHQSDKGSYETGKNITESHRNDEVFVRTESTT